MGDRDAETPELPNTWQEIQPDEIYQSLEGRVVSFSISQIQLGILIRCTWQASPSHQ